MSTYRFVSVSKGTENGDSYVRWENHDNRVFKRHGPLTTCVEVLEITGFGERQRVTPPVIQPCKQEMEESLGPEPEPCQEPKSPIIEGSLEVKLPTIWTDGKAEVGRVREEKSRREKIREEKDSEERRCRCAKR